MFAHRRLNIIDTVSTLIGHGTEASLNRERNNHSMIKQKAGIEPFKAFRFLIEIENPQSNVVVAAFSQFSGIKMRVDTIERRSGDETRGTFESYSGLTHYENVILTRGIIGDNDFMEWIYSAAPTEIAPPTNKNKYRNINVVALDDTGRRGITWTLYKAMPVAYELSPFDGARSELLSESIEFSIQGFKRVINN